MKWQPDYYGIRKAILYKKMTIGYIECMEIKVYYIHSAQEKLLLRDMLTEEIAMLVKKKTAPKEENNIPVNRGSLKRRIWKARYYYLMLLPAVLYIVLIKYVPMYGVQIAFRNFKVSLGVWDSPWVGLRNFRDFFNSYSFKQLLENTFSLSFYSIVVGFPIPIIVALVLNEIKSKYKNVVQTVLYAPHFISTVVLVGIMINMFSPSQGVVNTLLEALGIEPIYFFGDPKYFRHLYVWSGIWQGMGWGAIVYLAALAGVDTSLHEAADIDGATRMQKILYINIPTILPTIIIMLILKLGSIADVGYEKVYLMQTDLNVATSEVISTYVYKRGLIGQNYSFSAAVGLFNNLINVAMLLISNTISKKITKTGLF